MTNYMIQFDGPIGEPRWECRFNMPSDTMAREYAATVTAQSPLNGPFRLWRMHPDGEDGDLIASYHPQQRVMREIVERAV